MWYLYFFHSCVNFNIYKYCSRCARPTVKKNRCFIGLFFISVKHVFCQIKQTTTNNNKQIKITLSESQVSYKLNSHHTYVVWASYNEYKGCLNKNAPEKNCSYRLLVKFLLLSLLVACVGNLIKMMSLIAPFSNLCPDIKCHIY